MKYEYLVYVESERLFLPLAMDGTLLGAKSRKAGEPLHPHAIPVECMRLSYDQRYMTGDCVYLDGADLLTLAAFHAACRPRRPFDYFAGQHALFERTAWAILRIVYGLEDDAIGEARYHIAEQLRQNGPTLLAMRAEKRRGAIPLH
jgi:hypothetical protein